VAPARHHWQLVEPLSAIRTMSAKAGKKAAKVSRAGDDELGRTPGSRRPYYRALSGIAYG
jgi:hypothetical protein